MGELAHSVWIEAAPAAVWRTYVDPHRLPDWQTGRPVIEDVQGGPGSPGSSYVSRRGPLVARTMVLAAEAPVRLVTRTEAYFGLELVLTSRLTGRAGGTDLALTVQTHWSSHGRLVQHLVERAVLNDREARKELTNLKALVEREAGTTQGHPPSVS